MCKGGAKNCCCAAGEGMRIYASCDAAAPDSYAMASLDITLPAPVFGDMRPASTDAFSTDVLAPDLLFGGTVAPPETPHYCICFLDSDD